jgi:hypothetical protein
MYGGRVSQSPPLDGDARSLSTDLEFLKLQHLASIFGIVEDAEAREVWGDRLQQFDQFGACRGQKI